ncbi:lipopolysaccharide assembly protein LapB [Sporolactobacillus sp. THM19-2]|uniref:tetratricopeptide repeat protein n=1 Tax=Sporolactobacillus sp. THM19-2 TaxID=2511171 RepID=UPI001F0D8C78|nr:tetratricopeptide repeat protein [Sporolactobacillus sp. THM19-2]
MDDDTNKRHDVEIAVSDQMILKRISVCQALIKANKLNEAEKLISEMAKLVENNIFAQGLLLKEQGNIASKRKEYTQAIKAFEEALLYITPDHIKELMEIYGQLAEAYRITRNYVMAIEKALYGNILANARQVSVDSLDQLRVYYNLSYCYFKQKEFCRALEVIHKALQVMKETSVSYLEGNFYILKGSSESSLGDHLAALESDQTALSLFQTKKDEVNRRRIMQCLVNVGIDYRHLKKYNQSYTVLLRSYNMMEEGWSQTYLKNVIYELSLTLVPLEKYDEALDWIGKGLDIPADGTSMDGKLTYVMALIYFRQNDLQVAERSIDRANGWLKADTCWDGKCMKLKGMILFRRGQIIEAYKIADEALNAQLNEKNKLYVKE